MSMRRFRPLVAAARRHASRPQLLCLGWSHLCTPGQFTHTIANNAAPLSPQNLPKSTAVSGSSAPPLSLDALVAELQLLVMQPLPIGNLFKLLSPEARRALVVAQKPLEELLLTYPSHFTVYKRGSTRTNLGTVTVAPPALVPAGAVVMRLPGPQNTTSTCGIRSCDSTTDAASRGAVDPFSHLTPTQRLEEVLMYIPNEWFSYTALEIPIAVRRGCMGYPTMKPRAFFNQYPQFFEVRPHERGNHTFYVRRSLPLQQRIAARQQKSQ